MGGTLKDNYIARLTIVIYQVLSRLIKHL